MPQGLSSYDALQCLYDSLQIELNRIKLLNGKKFWPWLRIAFHHNSKHSQFRWPSVVLLFLEALCFIIVYAIDGSVSLISDAIFLLVVLIVNVFIVGWDTYLLQREIHLRAKELLNCIEDCLKQSRWDASCYAQLYQPQSPCVSLQWTVRDGQLINLPAQLLVEGDLITIRPGHQAPGRCSLVCGNEDVQVILEDGETFVPDTGTANVTFTGTKLRKPVEPKQFVMLETPFVKKLRLCLDNSLKRPVTVFNKEHHMVASHYLERMIIPIALVLTLALNFLYCIYLAPESANMSNSMLLHPALTILPLLPLSLPISWLLLNAIGMARLLFTIHYSKSFEPEKEDPFDETEVIVEPLPPDSISWKQLQSSVISLLLGQKDCLWRSSNLMQVLGSVTTLCCVDKKGILSWPNPTPEKVFFLKPLHGKNSSLDNAYFSTTTVDAVSEGSVGDLEGFCEDSITNEEKPDHMYHPGSRVEVLDLTHSMFSAFGVQFDDPKWKNYITNLKPLGLGILLNTCNPATQEKYLKFSDHIVCESLHNDVAVPVVNKRCLCDLAVQIGFTDQAVEGYQYLQHVAVFRHVQPEVIKKGRLFRSLNFPRLKMPFPNMCSAVVKEVLSGTLQMFTQGTADLVLDVCTEYWDGEDLCVLQESDRKRILDFYQRSSLTAYCMAFAYAPLTNCLHHSLDEMYLELPPDSSHLFPSGKKPATTARNLERQAAEKQVPSHYLSTDSIYLEDQHDDKLENCLCKLSNQVFIGMVTMQYQACPDFVKLIEQLEDACIRFVHFSKENELRSRGFSEKMGLESGWNCHISLLSDRHRTESGNSTCHPSQTSAKSVACLSVQSKHMVPSETSEGISGFDKKATKGPERSISAPSVVNLDMMSMKCEDAFFGSGDCPDYQSPSRNSAGLIQSPTDEEQISKETDPLWTNDPSVRKGDVSRSPSNGTDSTDRSAPVAFDISNRAKLPKGIENIRSHIENVDNVPLLVSLFTDCTPEATREMIRIMQEYGEVVCCLGSAANFNNIPIFLQADCSIAIEPLRPQLCAKHSNPNPSSTGISPADLGRCLNTLPCAVSARREDKISLYHLIMEARHYMMMIRNSLQFMLCCCLSLALVQLLGALFFLPLVLSPAHMLWLICCVIPLLSFSLLGCPVDPSVMSTATGKNLKVVSKQMVVFFLGCYCAKFCPSVVVSVVCFTLAVSYFCHRNGVSEGKQCWMLIDITGDGDLDGHVPPWPSGLTISQNITAFLLVLYFVTISIGFVHRAQLIWRRNPWVNKSWAVTSFVVLILQFAFCWANLCLNVAPLTAVLNLLKMMPSYVWLTGFIWPLVLLPLNELVKLHEIRANVRQQRKARLEFGTKLGMNSPF